MVTALLLSLVQLVAPASTASASTTYSETTGGVANTWTNYTDAGGTEGPQIAAYETVQIACAVEGFKVADGNTWWYQIASSPWNGAYYVSADPFYNEPGVTTGPLTGTPFVDPAVPLCGSPPPLVETTGGVANTWTDYTDAGGTEGPQIGAYETVSVSCRATGFAVADGNTWWYEIASSPWNNSYWASADAFYNNGQTSGSLIGTPFFDPAVPICSTGGVTDETTGGAANTWTDYTDAGGTQGPQIGAYDTVQITCRTTGFAVADGNTWWYEIASSPWSNAYWASADAFYNNGQTSGSLIGTPFYDPNVAICANTAAPFAETTGGVTHTWKNYKNAGGLAGQVIGSNQTVGVTCRATGFRVTDGNTWWYEIASSPWSNAYWASADAFYNNGQTTGSLVGTPFYDPAVPVCPVTVTTPVALSATQGVAYSKALAATGGELPYSWSVTSGSLPPGLIVSKAGKITGTPTQVGSWTFTLQAADSSTHSLTGSKTFKLTIKS